MDGCSTGISGWVSQGKEWKTANIATFYSTKLNMAQCNYPVHEIEMLVGIEMVLQHKDILQGVQFKWVTDHKGLIYLLNQKSISGHQARWSNKISSFLFKVVYVPGSKNFVADALSHIYLNDSAGTICAPSEFVHHNVSDDDMLALSSGMLILAGMEAVVATQWNSRPRKPRQLDDSAGQPETSTKFACLPHHWSIHSLWPLRTNGGQEYGT